ncbi:uncharacterized protein LOC134696496 [Mytilus trossulus]|uniref:uncharacterized protein LOC134696496 n=1 Tax=Mytilus trossulus TaxID=6551 RepID=UPI003006EB35
MPKSTANKMEKLCPAIFGIVALVLLCSGAFSPGWLVMDLSELQGYSGGSSLTVHLGLYYAVISGNGIRVTITYGEAPELEKYITTHLLEYQIETIIGFVLCLISIIITFAYSKTGSIGVLIAPIILYMLAGMITLMAVGRWLTKVLLEARENNVTLTVPYSIIFSGLGAVFCVVTMIIISRMLCKYNAVGQPQDDQESSEISEESYQQVQPKTKVTASMGQTQDIDLTTVLAYLTNLKNRDEMYAYAN